MSAFFSKLFTLLQSKIEKMLHLHCVVKFQLRKLDCALTWYENAVPQLRNCVALQLNEKVHCETCAALLQVEKIVALCCTALLVYSYLCPPLSICNFYGAKIRAMYSMHKTIQGISNLSTLYRRRSLKLTASDIKTIMNSISILYFLQCF